MYCLPKSIPKSMHKVRAYIAVILLQLSFAGMFLLSKASVASGMKPAIFAAYRLAFATLALTPVVFFFKSKEATPIPWRAICKIFIVSCVLAINISLNLFALKTISATFCTAMQNIAPPMVFILAVCLRVESLAIKERHGIAKVLGCIIGFSGAMAFTFYKGPPLYSTSSVNENNHSSSAHSGTHTKGEWIKGSILSFGAQSSWAVWLTMQAPLLKQYPGRLRLMALQISFCCVATTIYGAATERHISSWKLGWNIDLLSVAYCGIVIGGVNYWLQAWVIEKKGPVFTAIFSPLGLVSAAILEAIFLHDALHWGSVLGGAVMVVGLYSFLWGKNREPKIKAQQETHLESIRTSTPSIEEQANETHNSGR